MSEPITNSIVIKPNQQWRNKIVHAGSFHSSITPQTPNKYIVSWTDGVKVYYRNVTEQLGTWRDWDSFSKEFEPIPENE